MPEFDPFDGVANSLDDQVLAFGTISAFCRVSWDISDINIMQSFLKGDSASSLQGGYWGWRKILD